MATWSLMKPALRTVGGLFALYIVLVIVVYLIQRRLLFFPSHAAVTSSLVPWREVGRVIGYCREVSQPQTIWLMLHGNAGQAAHRDYVLPCLSEHDSFYVLEYPGYGQRAGEPSREAMNQAAAEAYRLLRARHAGTPVCVLAESIGSGPACVLAREAVPPDKLVLAVPFDSLANVAARRFPFLPVRLILRDRWDNVESLKAYTGAVQIIAAQDDTVVPIQHAQALARQVPGAQLITIPGGHNEWAQPGNLAIRR
jgi:uncharacterized protein